LEEQIAALLTETGPLTGAELVERSGQDPLLLWRSCRASKILAVQTIGRRYLRLDLEVAGYARLSPSILREFLTYSVIGITRDHDSLNRKVNVIASHIQRISEAKLKLAGNIFSAVLSRLDKETLIQSRTCALIAGDIAYGMAHDVPRPERSTGKLVKGSDMDLVIVVDDRFPKAIMEQIDETVYQEKHRILRAPHLREEIDYVVKDLDRVREQVRFDNFKHMVACKILQEGVFLYGNPDLFRTIKSMLVEKGVSEKLMGMKRRAELARRNAEAYLLAEDPARIKNEGLTLFYPAEESEEFE
jgi:hypothetical protein